MPGFTGHEDTWCMEMFDPAADDGHGVWYMMGDLPEDDAENHNQLMADGENILGFLGELLCFWLRSSSILHVKFMVGRAALELLRKSGAKGVSLEGKFG